MITSAVVQLQKERSWDPITLTAAALSWPGEHRHVLPLRDLASSLRADGWLERDVPVITPLSLDPIEGGVRRRSRKYRGAVFQVQESERGLRPGDLLVPTNPELPLLLVRPDHVGSLVSSAFLALRPLSGLGLWIWAVLTSRTGRAFRAHLATEAIGRTTTKAKVALLDLKIPIPSLAEIDAVQHRLQRIETETHREEEEARETWWRTTDLARGEWSLALAMPNPDVLSTGIPLGDLCDGITRGRPVPPKEYRDAPRPGLLPLTDIGVLSGRPVRRWLPVESGITVAKSGDIFVAAVGARPHAKLSTETTAVDSNVFRLRLRNRDSGPGIVHFLNGQTGYGLRQILLSGGVIPSMRKSELSRLPVPAEALEYTGSFQQPVSLDLQLEQALWG